MAGLNTDTSYLLALLKKTDEICPKHGSPLYELKGHRTCVDCQREKVEIETESFSTQAANQYNKRITYDRLKEDSIIGDITLKEATFDTYLTVDEETSTNKEKARQMAGRYLKGEVFNALITGKAGTGKSHLAKAILEAVNEHSHPYRSCLFLSLSDFILEIRNTFGNNDRSNHDTEQSMIDYIASVDLLVIDDLGAETGFIGTDKTASDFTQRVIYNLMNKRQDKSTIITTNLNSNQTSTMYDSKIISRLYRKLEGNIITFKNTSDKRISF